MVILLLGTIFTFFEVAIFLLLQKSDVAELRIVLNFKIFFLIFKMQSVYKRILATGTQHQ